MKLLWIYFRMNLDNSKKILGTMIYVLELGLCSWITAQITAWNGVVHNVSYVCN